MAVILLGAGAVVFAAFLGGLTGFGYNLLATPLLLFLGVHPEDAVPINLLIALLTRVSVVLRMRAYIRWSRAVPLTVGSGPGLVLGAALGGMLDPSGIRVVAGSLVLVVAPALMLRKPRVANKSSARYGVTGLLGGVLGTSTSLNGVPVALTLSTDQQDQHSFIADLAVYFVLSNLLGLIILGVRDGLNPENLGLLAWWLPGALLANALGTSLGSRVQPGVFRAVTCLLVMVAGVATLVSA